MLSSLCFNIAEGLSKGFKYKGNKEIIKELVLFLYLFQFRKEKNLFKIISSIIYFSTVLKIRFEDQFLRAPPIRFCLCFSQFNL